MSKIAIVLCIALFATAADSVFNDTSHTIVARVVNDVIFKVDLDMLQAHDRSVAEFEKILKNVFKKADDFSKKIIEIMVKAQADVTKVFADRKQSTEILKSKQEGFRDCGEIANPMWQFGGLQSRVMARANKCIVDELKEAYSDIRSIGMEYALGFGNITSIRAEIEKCDEVQDWSVNEDPYMTSAFCPQTVAAKAYEASVTIIPMLNSRVRRLADWWKAAHSKFDACTSVTHLNELRKETAAVVKATKECFEANFALLKKNKEINNRPEGEEEVQQNDQ